MRLIGELIVGRPLVHASPAESVLDVARRMSDRNIGAVAVLENGTLVGVFSERDLMSRVVAVGLDPDVTVVANVMTRDLVVARPLDDVNSALQKMQSLGCRHLPVVDHGALVGMISLRDLLQVDGETSRQQVMFLSELVTCSPDYET